MEDSECPLLGIDLSGLSGDDSALQKGSMQAEPRDFITFPRGPHLAKFASEECFDRILDHLASTPEETQGSIPNSAVSFCTRIKLDPPTLFSICRMLHHAIIERPDARLGTPAGTGDDMSSGWGVDPKILPRVLRCVLPWRLADPWTRRDGTFGEGDGALAELDAVELATALAALANNPRTCLEEVPPTLGPRRLKIKWLGRVDVDGTTMESPQENPALNHVSSTPTPELGPEIKFDELDAQLGELGASLFRSGCLACRRPRNASCTRTCDEAQQHRALSSSVHSMNLNLGSRDSTPHPLAISHSNRQAVLSLSTASEGVASKPKPGVRGRPPRAGEADTKENIPPAISQARHQGLSISRNLTGSMRPNPSQVQTTIQPHPVKPTPSSNRNPRESSRLTSRTRPHTSRDTGNAPAHQTVTVRTTTRPGSGTSTSRPSSVPCLTPWPRPSNELRRPTQPTLPTNTKQNPAYTGTRDNRSPPKAKTHRAAILGQRNC